MKKYVVLLLVLLLSVTLAGCSKGHESKGENNIEATDNVTLTEGEAALLQLQEEICAQQKLMGIAYLGFIDYNTKLDLAQLKNQEHVKEFPFIENIQDCIEIEGYRIYAIVPADNEVTLNISKCEFDDDFKPCAGEKLIETNAPVLVRCDVSDTIPNLHVVAQKGDLAVEYTPGFSGMDGKLDDNGGKIYDFTPYALMPEFNRTTY